MPDSKQIRVGGIALPLDVAAIEALPINPGGVMQFDFAYADIPFSARYEEGGDTGRLRLSGDVGPLPFSAESPAARAGLAQIIAAAASALGPVFRLAQGRIKLGRDLSIPVPATAVGLITAVAGSLIPAKPYLDLMSVYVRPPLEPGKVGIGAVRPEWRRYRQPDKRQALLSL